MLPIIRLNCYTVLGISLLFFCCLPGFAGDVSLAWDASVSAGVVGYKIYYGPSSGNYNNSAEIGNQTSYTVADLTAGSYFFAVTARDSAGNESGYSNEVSTVVIETPPPDTTPPVIGSVGSAGITTSGATISWTTNEASTTQVEYGLTTAYGSTTSLDATMQTSHSQALSGLTPGTGYHYRVRSSDAAGNLASSGDNTFTTKALTQPPTNLRVVP
jgi:fibronectin type 3 domain-containing protein